MPQNDKKFCQSPSISQEPYIIRLSSMLHMCEMIISPGVFFHFFKIFIFCVVTGVKLQKVQNDKKLCRSCSMSQEPCIIWSLFMIHMCKRIISTGVFFQFFKILNIQVSGVKKAKNGSK